MGSLKKDWRPELCAKSLMRKSDPEESFPRRGSESEGLIDRHVLRVPERKQLTLLSNLEG